MKLFICSNCNLELPIKRNLPKEFCNNYNKKQTIESKYTVCIECLPLWKRDNLLNVIITRNNLYNNFKIQNTLEQDHKHRTCRVCRYMLPLKLNFEVNNCTSTTGRIFRKWTCVQCRSIQKSQLRKLKKTINMNLYYGKPCPICLKQMGKNGTARAIPDHCHVSGNFRGVICNNCNTAIGKLKDDPILILRALRYLCSSQNM